VVAETLERMPHRDPSSVAEILAVDEQARRLAHNVIETNPAVFGSAGGSLEGSVRVPAQA